MLLANGARFGGHTLFIKERRLWYVNNFLGITPEQVLTSPDVLTDRIARPRGGVLQGEPRRRAARPSARRRCTSTTLAVAKSDWKTQPGHFALCGEGLTVGRDSSDPVTQEYGAPFAFTGGRIKVVEINIGDDVYVDRERDFHAAMSRD